MFTASGSPQKNEYEKIWGNIRKDKDNMRYAGCFSGCCVSLPDSDDTSLCFDIIWDKAENSTKTNFQ